MTEYTIRVSDCARRARLTMSPISGLVVVIPRGFQPERVPGIVRDHEGWIRRTKARIAQQGLNLPPVVPIELPTKIQLPALGEFWSVDYQTWHKPSTQLDNIAPGQLRISLPGTEVRGSVLLLHDWMKKRARQTLSPQLTCLATRHGFTLKNVSVRSQRTRWGSCSRIGTISLNFRLLLLPPHLVHYIMIHELAHLREMNHSPQFWAVVESFLPDYRGLRRDMRSIESTLPAWAALHAIRGL